MSININNVLKGAIFFLTGFLSCMLLIGVFAYSLELPSALGLNLVDNYDSVVPGDWIKDSQIHVYSDKIVIDLPGASMSRYADTGSMIPVLGSNSNGIRIVPQSEEQINIGDIISFKQGNDLIVHRVVEKGVDSEGVYFITKGDNNFLNDGKIRFSQVDSVLVAIIY